MPWRSGRRRSTTIWPTSKPQATSAWIWRRALKKSWKRPAAANDGQQISSLNPSLAVDATAKAASKDGNTVNLEQELMRMNQNAMTHSLETQMVSNMLAKMRLAISGK